MNRHFRRAICFVAVFVSVSGFTTSGAAGADDAAKAQIAKLFQQARNARTPADQKSLALELLAAADEMILANDFSSALRLASLAGDLARKARNNHILTLANAKRDRIGDITKAFKDITNAFKTLSRSPNDPEANFEAGRFTCLVKSDWETGLPMLSRGSEPAYRNLARAELNQPKQSKEQLALAQAWLELAKTESPSMAAAMWWRAHHWAQQALASASGGDRDLVIKFMDRLPIRYLTDMEELDIKPGPWPLGKHGETGEGQGKMIEIDGIPYPHGLGLHPPDSGFASVSYRLGGEFNTFVSGVAVNDHQTEVRGTVVFLIIGDGRVLWRSRPMNSYGQAQFCNVPVKNVDVLELRTQCAGTSFGTHAVWLDPHVAQ